MPAPSADNNILTGMSPAAARIVDLLGIRDACSFTFSIPTADAIATITATMGVRTAEAEAAFEYLTKHYKLVEISVDDDAPKEPPPCP